MALAACDDEPTCPLKVCAFGTQIIELQPDFSSNFVEEVRCLRLSGIAFYPRLFGGRKYIASFVLDNNETMKKRSVFAAEQSRVGM